METNKKEDGTEKYCSKLKRVVEANQNNGSGVTLGELFGDFFDEFEEEK